MGTRDIGTAHPTLQARFKAALRLFKRWKWISDRYEVKISCVMRTDEEQKALYQIGRTKPGNIVTYCDGVRIKSKHQPDKTGYSRAIDFFVVRKSTGKAIWRLHIAMLLFVSLCDEVGLECGYFWRMKDSFHVQMFDWDK